MVERAADNRDTQVQLLSGLPLLWGKLLEDVPYVMSIGTSEIIHLGGGIINHTTNQVSGLRNFASLNFVCKKNRLSEEGASFQLIKRSIFGIGIRRSGRVVKSGGL